MKYCTADLLSCHQNRDLLEEALVDHCPQKLLHCVVGSVVDYEFQGKIKQRAVLRCDKNVTSWGITRSLARVQASVIAPRLFDETKTHP